MREHARVAVRDGSAAKAAKEPTSESSVYLLYILAFRDSFEL